MGLFVWLSTAKSMRTSFSTKTLTKGGNTLLWNILMRVAKKVIYTPPRNPRRGKWHPWTSEIGATMVFSRLRNKEVTPCS